MKLIYVVSTVMIAAFVGSASAEDLDSASLESFTVVPRAAASAVVYTPDGNAIGVVGGINRRGGHPTNIEVVLPGGRLVRIAASLASYDPIANEIIADMSDNLLAEGFSKIAAAN